MGSPLVEFLKQQLFDKVPSPYCFVLYVDDTFACFFFFFTYQSLLRRLSLFNRQTASLQSDKNPPTSVLMLRFQ